MVSLRYRIIVHFTLVSFLCEALSVGNVAFDGGPLIDARCLYRVSFSPVFFPYYFHFFSIFIFWCSLLQKKKLKKNNKRYISFEQSTLVITSGCYSSILYVMVWPLRGYHTPLISSVFHRTTWFFLQFYFVYFCRDKMGIFIQAFFAISTPTRRDY